MLAFKSETDDLAIAFYEGCPIKRIYKDGVYSFSYTSQSAIETLREYVRKEEIPLRLTGVPKDALGELLVRFRHADVDAEDTERSFYRVSIKSEAELIDAVPTVECDGVVLSALTPSDVADYARLCRDGDTNKYWGYDYKDDVPLPSDEYFYESAMQDFCRGSAISFAVRYSGSFIGEAVLYAFDLAGGAEIALRLLPEWCGRGLGSLSLEALLCAAEGLGLITLRASVNKKNTVSLGLFSAFMDKESESDDCVNFILRADEEEL